MFISVALTNKLKIPTIAVCNIWMCLINHKMCVCIEGINHNNSTSQSRATPHEPIGDFIAQCSSMSGDSKKGPLHAGRRCHSTPFGTEKLKGALL